MVNALEWVLIGIVIYTLIVMALRARGRLPDYVKGAGPIVTLHTQRGKRVLDKLARPKRLWRAWGNLGIGISLVVMVGTFVMFLFIGYSALVNPPEPSAVTDPRNILAIPGVNQFLPLSAAPEIIAGVAIALVIHEGGHGLYCRVGDIEIDSMGSVFFAFIPIGAFVQPDEESLVQADRGDQARMFVAGVTNNFAFGLIVLLLLFGPVIASFSVVAGIPIGNSLPGGPADAAGIDSGDVITEAAGQQVTNVTELREVLVDADSNVKIVLQDGRTVSVERWLYVRSAVQGAPVSANDTITAVNGTAVATVSGYYETIENRSVATLSRAEADPVTTPIGGYTRVRANGSLTAANAPPGEAIIITRAGGERILTGNDLIGVVKETPAGDEIRVVAYVDDRRTVYRVEVRSGDTVAGRLGGDIYMGTSGFEVGDFGIGPYPAGEFLHLLGGDGGPSSGFESLGLLNLMVLFLALPFLGITGIFSHNFPGFTGIATNFYTVSGPLEVLGLGGAFLFANLLYWTAWINLNLAIFNLFPMYPLDGGHVLRTSTESIVSRLPIDDGRRLTSAITIAITVLMLASIAAVFVAPRLLT